MKPQIPVLVQRCLAHQIQIAPYLLAGILEQYETKKIPDYELNKMDSPQLRKYVSALDLSARGDSCNWTKGHSVLKELGFVEKRRIEGHRNFVSLSYENKTHLKRTQP